MKFPQWYFWQTLHYHTICIYTVMIKHVLYWQHDSFIELCEIACSLTIVSSNNSNGTINQYYKEQSTRARTVDNRGCGIARLGQEISARQHLTEQRRQIVITGGRNHTGRSQGVPNIWQPDQRSLRVTSRLYCTLWIGRTEIYYIFETLHSIINTLKYYFFSKCSIYFYKYC